MASLQCLAAGCGMAAMDTPGAGAMGGAGYRQLNHVGHSSPAPCGERGRTQRSPTITRALRILLSVVILAGLGERIADV